MRRCNSVSAVALTGLRRPSIGLRIAVSRAQDVGAAADGCNLSAWLGILLLRPSVVLERIFGVLLRGPVLD